jgi:hypothetical protein
MTDRYDRFRAYTISERLPKIVAGVSAAASKAAINVDVGQALTEIASDTPIGLTEHPEGWDDWLHSVAGKRPSELPFLDFEYWFYCRILELTGHFQSGFDPFGSLKRTDLAAHLPFAEASFQRTTTVADGLDLSLNGNAMDLSQIARRAGTFNLGKASSAVGDMAGRKLNIIGDNFGAEFIGDVILGVRYAQQFDCMVSIHVKRLPLFVSDTTEQDVRYFLGALEETATAGGEFARTVLDLVNRGRIGFEPHAFWSSPYNLSVIPDDIQIEHDDFTILKGDLNYRRALGDIVCPIETPFEQLPRLPRYAMLALRSVKSYCLAGVDLGEWPQDLPKEHFPMDGSIFTAQQIESRQVSMVSRKAEVAS